MLCAMVDSRAPGAAAGSDEAPHGGLHRALYRIADLAKLSA